MEKFSGHSRALPIMLAMISAPILSGCDTISNFFGGSGSGNQTITRMDATDVEPGTISDDMVVLDEAAVDGTAIDTSAPVPLPGTGPAAPKSDPVAPGATKIAPGDAPPGDANATAVPSAAAPGAAPVVPKSAPAAPAQKTSGNSAKQTPRATVKQTTSPASKNQ